MSDPIEPGTAVVTEPKSELMPTPAANKIDLGAIRFNPFDGRGAVAPATFEEALNYATMMAKSDFCVPVKFRMNPGACLAVAQTAWRWGMDPYAVCWKAYVTKDKGGNERLAFEAQLIAAVVNTRAPIVGRVQISFSGEGANRTCTASALFKGEENPAVLTTPPIGKIPVKNSPLWASDPDQQLSYYAQRSFGRRYCPEVLLGVYTPEEIAVSSSDINAPRAAMLPEPEGVMAQDLSFLEDDAPENDAQVDA